MMAGDPGTFVKPNFAIRAGMSQPELNSSRARVSSSSLKRRDNGHRSKHNEIPDSGETID